MKKEYSSPQILLLPLTSASALNAGSPLGFSAGSEQKGASQADSKIFDDWEEEDTSSSPNCSESFSDIQQPL